MNQTAFQAQKPSCANHPCKPENYAWFYMSSKQGSVRSKICQSTLKTQSRWMPQRKEMTRTDDRLRRDYAHLTLRQGAIVPHCTTLSVVIMCMKDHESV